MRISKDSRFNNAFVTHAFLGDTPVQEIWLGGKRLYPSDEDRVKRLYVELPDAYSDAWCVLQHGLHALKLASKATGYMILRVGSMSWCVGFAHSAYDVATLSGRVFTFGADEGPSSQDVAKLETAELHIILPVHRSDIIEARPDTTEDVLPILPNTVLQSQMTKAKKETPAQLTVSLLDGDDVVMTGGQSVRGSKRGAWNKAIGRYNGYIAMPRVQATVLEAFYPHASTGRGWLDYPAISQTLTLPITLTTNQ